MLGTDALTGFGEGGSLWGQRVSPKPDPDPVETRGQLIDKWRKLHPNEPPNIYF